MASAEQYAQWIVANQDKQGTPEFDTVVQAYQQAKLSGTSSLPEGGLFSGAADVVKGLAGGGLTEVVSGLGGLTRAAYEASPIVNILRGELPSPSSAALKGAETVQQIQEAAAPYVSPSTQAGARALTTIGDVMEPIASGLESASQYLGDVAYDITGKPSVAAAAYSTPTAILEAIGIGSLKRLMPNVTFLDASGNPTPELLSGLRKLGLSWEDLKQAAQAQVPAQPQRSLISGEADVPKSLEPVVASQISAGGTEAKLAPLASVGGERVTGDVLAQQALKQWDNPKLIQSIKQATPETKAGMQKQMSIYQRAQNNLDVTERPSDVAGQSAARRIQFLEGKADEAKKELDAIAANDLPGVKLNPSRILEQLYASLAEIDVGIDTSGPIPKPIFEGSTISQDKTSQAAIKRLFALLGEDVTPDALRFHKMKRQIDALVDYKKKSKSGLTKEGEKILKDTRKNLNNALREYSDDYARVNDDLTRILTLFDELDSVSGSRADIRASDADVKLGQEFRKLFSQYGVRPDMQRAVENLEKMAAEYGGQFNDSTRMLANFAVALDNRFGPIAETGFKAEIGQAIKGQERAKAVAGLARDGMSPTGVANIMERMAGYYNAARGVNDDRAYGVMEALLRRNGQ